MSRVRVVANGLDDDIDLFHNFWGLDLPTRIRPLIEGRGYMVTSATVKLAYGTLSLTTPYQLDLSLETLLAPADTTSVRNMVSTALLQATGYEPSAVSVISAGQPMPPAPSSVAAGVVTDAYSAVQGTLTAAQWGVVALAVGAGLALILLAKNPGTIRALTR
jgi:hypothetical protein